MLHGEDDRIVPVEQATGMLEAVRNSGGTAKLHIFEGEGHGWRQAKSIRKALKLELEWYQAVLNNTVELQEVAPVQHPFGGPTDSGAP